MINWLYKRYKDQFIKLYLEECRPKASFAQMEYRFTDSNGKKYFGYPKDLETSMSFDRQSYWHDYYTWFSRSLSEETLHRYLDIIDEALENGIANKTKKSASIIGAVSRDIRQAKDYSKGTEILYNMLACQLIREDEDLMVFSNKIQKEKVIQFKWETENNNAFFLHMKEYTHLFASTITSPEDLLKSLQKADLVQKEVLKKLNSLL